MSWWLRWSEHSVTLDGHTVGLFDGAETGGNACLAGGDGPAVAVAVGVFGERLAVALDLTDVSFTFVGVSGDGEHNNISRGGVQDESDGLGFGVATGQGYRRGLAWGLRRYLSCAYVLLVSRRPPDLAVRRQVRARG